MYPTPIKRRYTCAQRRATLSTEQQVLGKKGTVMKFMYFFLPTLPATMEERRQLRPIAMHPDRWQRMIEEVVEVSQLAESVGFDAVCFPEHHLHS
jgi:hypothetical protein